MTTTYYRDTNEVIEYAIIPALGVYAQDYDVQAIVKEITDYKQTYGADGIQRHNDTPIFIREDIDFWDVVAKHDLTA